MWVKNNNFLRISLLKCQFSFLPSFFLILIFHHCRHQRRCHHKSIKSPSSTFIPNNIGDEEKDENENEERGEVRGRKEKCHLNQKKKIIILSPQKKNATFRPVKSFHNYRIILLLQATTARTWFNRHKVYILTNRS